MRHLSLFLSVTAIVLVLVALTAPLSAQPDKSRGDAEALAGQQLYEQGNFHDAAGHFVAAYQADPQPAYLFNIAQAYRFAKECASSAKYFRLFLDAMKDVKAQNLDKVHHYLDEMDTCAKAEASPPAPPPAPQPAVETKTQVAPPAPLPAPADPGRTKRRIGIAVGAAGVVGLAVGGYFTHRVFAIHDEAQAYNDACTQLRPCAAQQVAAYTSSGNTAEQREIISYAVGGAALAAGVVLYMLGRTSDEHSVAAIPTRGGALVTAGFSF